MMDDAIRNLRALWRAESLIGEIRLRHLAGRSGLAALAGLVATFGLLMLNVAGFFAFEQRWGPVWAAVGVSVLDFCAGLTLLLIARRSQPGRELELALELRSSALKALEVNAHAVQSELIGLRDEVRSVRKAVSGFARNPLDAALPALIVPLAAALVKHLKKPEQS